MEDGNACVVERKHVFGEMDMYIWLCKDTGAMNRPLRLTECFVGVCGMFATHFVGGRCIIANRSPHFGRPQAAVGVRFIVPAYTYSQQHCTPFEMLSRNVRKVFILCMLHIHHAKVWFLRHKSMVFGVQKPPFYIAKTPLFEMPKWGSEFRAYTAILKHRMFFAATQMGGGYVKKMIR